METSNDTIRILVADDAEDFRLLLKTLLGNHGQMEIVGEAADGEEAIALTRELDLDVVLLDLSMPNVDGLQALETIRDLNPELPVIILTGFAKTDLRQRAEALGATAYVEKGPAMKELPQLIIETCS